MFALVFAYMLLQTAVGAQDNFIAYVEYPSVGNPSRVVKIRRAGENTASVIYRIKFLRAGDTVITGSHGSVSLYQVYAPRVLISSATTKTIKPLRPKSGRDLLTPDDFRDAYLAYADAQRDIGVDSHGKQYGESNIAAIAPRYSLVLDGHPRFRWKAIKDTQAYTVRLLGALDPDHVFWEKVVPARSGDKTVDYAYPEDQPLTPGEYKWQVVAKPKSDVPGSEDDATFTVADVQHKESAVKAVSHARQFAPAPNLPNLLLITAYFKNRMYLEAEEEAQKALVSSPRNLDVTTLLMAVYQAMQRPDLRADIAKTVQP